MNSSSCLRICPLSSHACSHLPRNIERQRNAISQSQDFVIFSLEKAPELKGNAEEQQRILNLGMMTDHLKAAIPTLLQKSLPKALLLQHVLLRICPSFFEQINSYLPNIKGHASYYATCKAAQIFLTSFLLNPHTQLHIELIRTSKFSDSNCLYSRSTKIFVRWSTCSDGCTHLLNPEKAIDTGAVTRSTGTVNFSTANAKLGSHRWSSIDSVQILDHLKQNWTLTGSIVDLAKSIAGVKKDDAKLERIILGIFIFELNEENNQIVVHTIENLNIIERSVEEDVENKLRVC
ncbi:hypothetical protein METBIDRAFT_44116 [Metschnikowia bicuspidata var. bicuspidata NRRL YB-4993]|uniref:Uncharacterized protein n=1 Tax=Metschnikowia bicuspidata var. bicuspidata NRRL YB-4993 TaxID=869754 RepID=A0A1A0H9K7_9ASCO|nr:hypothetical protein METBIDRAFT_44116 [Metschnikowia bicuspidata var. bicuspidata NRRL YB-4993]OBA20563.1 hypothetical protein METBIDRAFT_44116 [Metschnikowia bicuspidata var. bicuspidata NRRL YB-4993]